MGYALVSCELEFCMVVLLVVKYVQAESLLIPVYAGFYDTNCEAGEIHRQRQ